MASRGMHFPLMVSVSFSTRYNRGKVPSAWMIKNCAFLFLANAQRADFPVPFSFLMKNKLLTDTL